MLTYRNNGHLKPIKMIVLSFLLLLIIPIVSAHVVITYPPPPGPFPPPPPCEAGMCCDKPGGPNKIVFQSGEETFKRTDMVVNGVYPIKISRTYSSNTHYDSPLGYGWAFSFNKSLYEYPDQTVVIRHGCGNLNRYINTGNSYIPDSSLGSQSHTLVKNPDGSFTVTYPKGEKDNYDLQGRLTATFDVEGNSLEFTYDQQGKLPLWGSSPNTLDPSKSFISSYVHRLEKIEVRHASGAVGNNVTFAYNQGTGRISTITSNDGRVVTYQHDLTVDGKTLGNLTGVDGLDGKVSIYKYEDTYRNFRNEIVYRDYHNITHIQEGLNATPAIISYNSKDQAYKEKYGNSVWTYDFFFSPFQTTVKETIKDDQGNFGNFIATATTVYQFDGVGFIEFKRDALGNETSYTLDSFGNKLKEQIYQGSEATGILIKLIDRTYNGNSNPLTEVTTLLSGEVITTTYTYDGTQKASEQTSSSLTPSKLFRTEWLYNHDTNGNATTIQEERRFKDDGTYLSTTYTYNSQGNVLTTTLPDAHVIENEYDAAYDERYVTKTFHRIAGLEVPSLSEAYTYDNKGNRNSVTDARGKTTTTVYDDSNRRISVTNHLNHVTSYTYDDRDNITQITRDRSVVNDQLDITRLSYDGENRLTQIARTDAVGGFVVIKQNTYDSDGQLFTTTNSLGQTNRFSYDLLHRLTGITNYKNESISYTLDVLGNRTREEVKDSSGVIVRSSDATYDALNRQLTQIGATNNQTTTYTYDAVGNRATLSDALSRPTTQYTYDTLSRLTNVQDANAKNTAYGYHDRGWLQTVTDPRNLLTTYNYNELGQLDNLVSPDTGTTRYTYDLAGNKQTKNDARNITVTYVYDDLNRLTNINYPDTAKNVIFTYDQNTFGLGKLSRITDESGSTSYTYNHWGDLIQETKVINGNSFSIGYAYDTEHRLISTTYPSGRVVTLTPGANQDFASISSLYQTTTQPILSNITYMPFGGVDTASYGNGLALNHDYDLDYRLTLQQAGTAYDRTTNYNDVNNITDITNNLDATKSQNFIYDDLDRLTDATGIYGTDAFGYDDDGNRVLETKNGTDVSTYNYPTTSNKLNDITGTKANTYGYDLNGNTTSKNGMTFTYDNTNRMSQAVNGAVTTNYKYDGKGQRVVKDVAGTTVIYIFDKDGKLIAEADGGGVVQRDYVYFGGRPVALATVGGAPAVFYYHVDHLGSPQVLTNQLGTVVWAGDYGVFGEVNLTTNVVESNLRFPGQYFDSETNLHYNYFRDYDATLGRYITSDPIGLAGGMNTYSYVMSMPTIAVDLFGLRLTGICDAMHMSIGKADKQVRDRLTSEYLKRLENIDNQRYKHSELCTKDWRACKKNSSKKCPPPTAQQCENKFSECIQNKEGVLSTMRENADRIYFNAMDQYSSSDPFCNIEDDNPFSSKKK